MQISHACHTVLIKNTLPCQTRAVRGYPRVPASTRTEFLPLAHNTHSRGVKWRSRGRRVKREPSVKSSVLSNESYFKRNLVMANQLYSCQKERIASFWRKEIIYIDTACREERSGWKGTEEDVIKPTPQVVDSLLFCYFDIIYICIYQCCMGQ